jgi:phasin
MTVMADPANVSATTPKNKKAAATAVPSSEASKFEFPKFEIPKIETPKFGVPPMEIPAAFREFAEKSIERAKEIYEKAKGAAEQTTDIIEDTYSAVSKGCTDYNFKLIETTRANSNAAFVLYGELLAAKSYADVLEKTTAYTRAQFDRLTEQSKELSEQAQKACTDAMAPIRKGFSALY